MTVLTRAFLIVLLWALCWGALRTVSYDVGTRFVSREIPSPSAGSPLFRAETINPDQGLPMVHVASLTRTRDGILHCVWYGGSGECRPDVRIYLAHKEPGGRWTAPVAIMTREQAERDLGRPVQALGNALLIAEADGSLRLLFVTISMGKWSGSQLNSSISRDGGISWSRSERLTLSPFFNLSELVRNRPVPLEAGGWCVPVYQEFLGKFPELLWLSAEGRWRKSRIAGGCSVFQPSLIPTGGDSAVALLRDYTVSRKIHIAASHDGGKTWPVMTATTLPNPDAGISGLRLSDGTLLAAYNDSPLNRSDLSLAISKDGGKSWAHLVSLQHEEGETFSYPYLLLSSEGLISMAYTWKGTELRLVSFNESWVRSQEAVTTQP